jgi:molybdate transport system substrate-binding protein
VEHVDDLARKGRILAGSQTVYARGILALWSPRSGITSVGDLTNPHIRFIAIAKPEAAPYGKAAVETLQRAGIWPKLEPKIVYAANINMARQFASTGNADAAFTSYSLVLNDGGSMVRVDEALHAPIDQALGIVASSPRTALAKQFTGFIVGATGMELLKKNGYLIGEQNRR